MFLDYAEVHIDCFCFNFGSRSLFLYIRASNYSFNGVIENVSYEYPKHIPTMTIKGIDYNLFYLNWSNNTEDIAVGDSAIKRKGTTSFILIKKKNIFHSK